MTSLGPYRREDLGQMGLVHVDVDGDDGRAIAQHADEDRVELDAVLRQQQHAVVGGDAGIGEYAASPSATRAKLSVGQPLVLVDAVHENGVRPLARVANDRIVKRCCDRHCHSVSTGSARAGASHLAGISAMPISPSHRK